MATAQRSRKKKYFTVEEANRTLPLVRAIVKDIVPLAQDLQQRQERLARVHPEQRQGMTEPYQEEFQVVEQEFQRDAARLEEYVDELRKLGVEIKGWEGIVDFPGWMDDREVCLCWKLGEPEVAHWHEVDAGFAGRHKLLTTV